MKRVEARVTHVAVWLAAGTGSVYGWMAYFAESADEFALVNHPWQPTMHLLHVVTVPLFVFASGLLWQTHVVAKLRSGAPARRRTGLFLLATALPMVTSGYAVQVSVADGLRTLWAWVHGVSSVLFTAGFVVHLCVRVAQPTDDRRESTATPPAARPRQRQP